MIDIRPKPESALAQTLDVSVHSPESATLQICAKVLPSDPDMAVLRIASASGKFVLPVYIVACATSLAFLRQLRAVVSDLVRWMEGRLCYGCEDRPPAGDLAAPALCATCIEQARADAAAQGGA